MLSESQRNGIHYAIPVLEHIDIEGSSVLAGRGYNSHQLIDSIYEKGGEPTIPYKKEPNLSVAVTGGNIRNPILLKNIFLN